MKQLFEPVLFDYRQLLIWEYQIYTDDHYKGYYHWHQCCEIMFVHRGQGSIVVNQQMYDIRPGMLFFSSLISCTGSIRKSPRSDRSSAPSSISTRSLPDSCYRTSPKGRPSSLLYGRATILTAASISATAKRPWSGSMPITTSAGANPP